MVIGSGLMARTFDTYKTNDDVLIFASGVSDSKAIDHDAFLRELTLLKEMLIKHPKKKLVYFSTCSIENNALNTLPYVQHKLAIEHYIKTSKVSYLIVRLPQVVGAGGNQKTIFNFLANAICNRHAFEVWSHAKRNFIDKDDVLFIVDQLLTNKKKNTTVNVAMSHAIGILEVVRIMEAFFKKKAQYTIIEKGEAVSISIDEIKPYIEQIEKQKGIGLSYVQLLLKKYFDEASYYSAQ